MAAGGGTIEVDVSPTPDLQIDSPDGLGEATTVLVDAVEGLLEGLLRCRPLIAVGPLPLTVVVASFLLALSVAGVPVGAALAGLGTDHRDVLRHAPQDRA